MSEERRPSLHERAGYPAPWHSDWCRCEVCVRLCYEVTLDRIAAALERIASRLEGEDA